MKTLLLTFLIGTSLSIASPVFAHGDEDVSNPAHKHESSEQESATASGSISKLESGYAALADVVKGGKFDQIHELVEGIEPALKALADTHKDDATITGAVTQLGKVLSDLHEAGDAKDAGKAEAELKKLEGGIKLLKARVPAEVDHESHHKTENSLHAEAVGLDTLKSGQENTLTLKLTDAEGKPVTTKGLQEVHTKKVHLLVVDETLGDYHHLHPTESAEAGTYTTSFTPKKEGTYKVWVNVVPVGMSQQYVPVELKGEKPCTESCIEKTVITEGEQDGLKASLSFEKPLMVGSADLGKISITDDEGKPVTDLEPVMGAFAHIVAFYDDFATVAHVHPMGEEPKSDDQRGGPELSFHLEPEKAGFLKIYVQVKRGGKDIFIPMGVNIEG